jgi:predicted AAA+ superfamily ATPase
MMIERQIELPARQSFFLLGARQTGKSTLIDARYPHGVWKVDLLLSELFLQYAQDPSRFRKEAEAQLRAGRVRTIFIDEIQRVPALLNEVQVLMQASRCQFILTGSSARKLKRGGANLLAGRAVERRLFPLTCRELAGQGELNDLLRFGSLPPLLGRDAAERTDFLTSYVHTYLREEIQAEGIARNIGGFSRFLDLAASQCGELVSFSAMSRECALPVRTVQSYYDILEDTLIGLRLSPWRRSARKRLVGHPKFYFFDLGVTNALNKRLTGHLDRPTQGRLFEQLLVLEAHRLLQYARSEANLFFWRTNHGAEVDLVIEKHGTIRAACEIKHTANISGAHLSGLRAFREEHSRTPRFVACLAARPYELEGVQVLPWREFLEMVPSLF